MAELPEDLVRELLNTFQVEAAEHLQTLNRTLLKIERVEKDGERRELVQIAFRAAHSLKGAARAVGLQDIESLAHNVENVLQRARDTDTLLEPKVCDVLYSILDGVQHILEAQPVDITRLQLNLEQAIGSSPGLSAPPVLSVEKLQEEFDETIASTSTDETIRIAVSKIDELMAQTGELLISKINAEQRLTDLQVIRQQLARWPRAWREIKTLLKHVKGESGQRLQSLLTQHYDYLQALTRSLDTFEQTLGSDTLRLGMISTDLQDDVRRARMLPFQTIALSLERTVRDAARTEGKQVAFTIEGSDTELDKKVLETLKDPLVHLLRNAVGHGIEIPEERKAAGKSAEGRVRLVIRQRGSEVSLTISDDGRGFDLAGLRRASEAEAVDGQDDGNPDNTISLAFLPGVTTAQQVTAISGRGVGLDVVRQRIEDIHGRLAVNNAPGKGVAIELIVPSSVTMTRGLVVRVGNAYFALPLLSIERIVEVRETYSIGGKQILQLGQMSLPLVPLAAVLERSGDSNSKPTTPLAVIISVAEQRLALLVDEVLLELELAVKPLGEPLHRVRNVIGAALLGSGEPIVILNPGDLIRSARGARMPEQILAGEQQKERVSGGHILVVDDSITTRTLEKNILEAAGFRVTIAVDGIEALKRLKEQEIDLVVTDIQMPNMDGIALTSQIRETANYKHLPVILVTSLESQEDREKGMLAGADAYIVKRGFNQATLLTTIQQFLESVI
jgi:two-component system, chemotaxis family, sensor kinase CheA